MAELDSDQSTMHARIVYWGISGAGVSSNLAAIQSKLRSDHRGELQRHPTRIDPTVVYEQLPIELGQVQGVRTLIQIVAPPGDLDQAPTRMQLLDQVDGLVLVLDARQDKLDSNLAHIGELRQALAAYGRRLDDLPVVIQYNRRDESDPFVIEELHRRVGLPETAVFEAVASESTGVLETLTTISKRVVRELRMGGGSAAPAQPITRSVSAAEVAPAPVAELEPEIEPEVEVEAIELEPVAEFSSPTLDEAPVYEELEPIGSRSHELLEAAILAEDESGDLTMAVDQTVLEAQGALDQPWESVAKESNSARIGADFQIVSVGTATRSGERGLRIPVVLGNQDGETVTLALTVQLDPLLDDDPL